MITPKGAVNRTGMLNFLKGSAKSDQNTFVDPQVLNGLQRSYEADALANIVDNRVKTLRAVYQDARFSFLIQQEC